MQFNQPGFYGQPFTFNNPYQFNGYLEVVGEGNVTSVMSPDGSMQLLFLPTTQWWRPFPCNINAGNVNNSNWNPTGAWFIRSVFSPLQPIPCQVQPLQTPSGIAFPRTYSSDCCVSQPACPPPNFELKFHNDICTSTSDIHYFYPSLRPCYWLKKPIGRISDQVDSPMLTNSVCHHEVICTKPCNCCMPMDQTENIAKVKCSAQKSQTSFSDTSMSCDTDKSRIDCVCFKGTGEKARKEMKKSKPKKITKTKKKCKCKKQKTSEKCLSTVVDQACGGVEDRGRETQTACGQGQDTQTTCEIGPLRKVASGSTSKNEVQAELRKPKTKTGKKVMKTKSSENFSGVSESDCCSGTCSCHSDTD